MPGILRPLFVLCCVFGFMLGEAGASGMGAYIEGGGGQSDFTIDDDVNEWDLETDKRRLGFGFVYDTNVARDLLFNYRLQVGLDKWREETDFDTKLDLTGISITQDFGFGILRTPHLRVWVGPELRLAFVTGSPQDSPDFDIYLFNYGVGPVLGANFHIGSTLTLAIKAGYLFEGYAGIGQTDTGTGGSFVNPGSSNRVDDDDILYTGASSQVYLNFAILFRINDAFRNTYR